MGELHDILWSVCRKLPSDFEPYGQRDRDTAEPSEDCSCGCRHFVGLVGDLGFDWGVCANKNSPRAGLLTFEHQGCPQFESIELPGEPEAAPLPVPETMPVPAPKTAKGPIKIDFDDLVLPLEHNDSSGLGIEFRSYLDTATGEVLAVCSEDDDYEEMCARIDGDAEDRYARIEPLESHEGFQIMDNFAASLPEGRIKSRLLDALSRNKPFRRFKDVINSDAQLREQWFAFHEDALAEHVRAWLEGLGIKAELLRRKT